MTFKVPPKQDTTLIINNTKINVDTDYRILEKLRKTFVYRSANVSIIKEKLVKKLTFEYNMCQDKNDRIIINHRLEWAKKWDGTSMLFYKNYLGTGHLQSLLYVLDDLNEPYTLIDKRKKTGEFELHYKKNLLVLRPEQADAMEEVREADFQGLLQLATGFGKTIMGISMIAELTRKTIVFVNTQIITEQWLNTINTYFDLEYDTFKTSSSIIFYNKKGEDVILLCSVAFVSNVFKNQGFEKVHIFERNIRIKKFIKQTDFLIFDEVQDAGTKKTYSMLNKIPAYYKIGLSATIHSRTDNRDYLYLNYFGDVLYEHSISSMIDDGKRNWINIHFMICKSYDTYTMEVPVSLDTYPLLYEYKIAKNKVRNQLIIDKVAELRKMGGKKILILVEYVAQGEYLNKQIPNSEYMQGSTTKKNRVIIKDKFLSDELDVLVASSKLANKGFSLINLNTIFLMDNSTTNGTIQSLGRLFHSNAETLELYDIYDTIPPFSRHSRERFKIYKKEKIGKIIRLKELRKELPALGK